MQQEQQSIEQQHHGKEYPHMPQKIVEERELRDIVIKYTYKSDEASATAPTGLYLKDGEQEQVMAYNPVVTLPLKLETDYIIYANGLLTAKVLRYLGEVDGETPALWFASE